jgi:hypothetical protein
MEGGAPARGTQFTTQFTCFTSTKVQILTPEELVFHQGEEVLRLREQLESQNVEAVQLQVLKCTCFTSPKVQIPTQNLVPTYKY